MAGDERLKELEERYEGYAVYDRDSDEIGKVDDILVDDNGREEYIGVKLDSRGPRSTLIPVEAVRVNERECTVEVAQTRERLEEAPTFDDDITLELEERIRRHFGLKSTGPVEKHGSRGLSTGAEAGERLSEDAEDVYNERSRERAGQEEPRSHRVLRRRDQGGAIDDVGRDYQGAEPVFRPVRRGERDGARVEDAGRWVGAPPPDPGGREHGGPALPGEVHGGRGDLTDYSLESVESHGGGESEEVFDLPPDEDSGARGEGGGRTRVRRRTRRQESNKFHQEESEYRSGY